VVLTLFHDYTSPASAIAVFRLQRLADEGLPVAFEGFEAVGVDVTLPVSLDVLAALDALREPAAAEGLRLRRPPGLPPTGSAHVIEAVASAHDLGASWRATCYRAFWERGEDLADAVVLTRLAEQAGLPAAGLEQTLADRRLLVAARRRMAAHRRQGVGGVPTILTERTLVPGLLSEPDLRALAEL
jgi:2-hydroxychromene-2-carboxylate isomerase